MSASGPIETEIKLPVADPVTASTLLKEHGFAVSKPRVFEANVVFDTPSRELRAAGCVLRVRSSELGNLLTFKGRAQRLRHKSREEIESGISDAAAVSKVLTYLGYEQVFRYEKYRTEFGRAGESGIVTLDQTPVGCFLEIEGESAWIDRIASELGFSEADYETASYGSLYLRHCKSREIEPTNMVFPAP